MSAIFEHKEPAPIETAYVFDNSGGEASARFEALAAIFDEGTIRHLEARGVGAGWQCLEVGGGGGSIAAWLATQVGTSGRVLATDIDTRFLEALRLPNLEVRRHNIANDPLPEAAFDLVHARLVLMHLPQREQALARMVAALKPGGWIVVEEFDSLSLLPDPVVNLAEVALQVGVALRQVLAERGVDARYGRLLSAQLDQLGLTEVGAEGRVFMWRGGTAGASLCRANYEQLRDEIIDTGLISAEEFASDLSRLNEINFMVPSSIMWATWGRRPVTQCLLLGPASCIAP